MASLQLPHAADCLGGSLPLPTLGSVSVGLVTMAALRRVRLIAPVFDTLMLSLYRFRMFVNLGGMLDMLKPSCWASF